MNCIEAMKYLLTGGLEQWLRMSWIELVGEEEFPFATRPGWRLVDEIKLNCYYFYQPQIRRIVSVTDPIHDVCTPVEL